MTDDVKTIGDVERIVHASGLWDGSEPVEFSNTGSTWFEAWAPSEAFPHPVFARITVHRKDVTVPSRVTVVWDERRPAEAPWADRWDSAPTRHFGRAARMEAFRRTFRDILGDTRLEDETTPGRDWAAEFAAASTPAELDTVVREAKTARIFTPDADGTALDRAWKTRRRELTETPAEAWKPKPQDHLPPVNRAARRKKGNRR